MTNLTNNQNERKHIQQFLDHIFYFNCLLFKSLQITRTIGDSVILLNSRFDEVHFGKFASFYLRREYYFDVHPPFGKLVFALAGYFIGYDGSFSFDKIGLDYIEQGVPYIALRMVSVLSGTLIVPLCYLILKERHFSHQSTLFGTSLVLLDTALVTQTRFILLDGLLLLFIVLACYSWTKFERASSFKLFNKESCFWLALCGVSMTLATGVKMVGLLTVLLIGVLTIRRFWEMIDKAKNVPSVLEDNFRKLLEANLCTAHYFL